MAWGSDSHEPNDSIAKTSVLRGNQYIEANLDSGADVDHYFIALRAGQTQALVVQDAAPGVVAETSTARISNTPCSQAGRFASIRPARSSLASAVRTKPHQVRVIAGALAIPNLSPSYRAFTAMKPISLPAPGLVSTAPAVRPPQNTGSRGDDLRRRWCDTCRARPTCDIRCIRRRGPSKVAACIGRDGDGRGECGKRATMNIGPCRGGIRGPLRNHTPSNRPEYWHVSCQP